jgi:hypothetical protein
MAFIFTSFLNESKRDPQLSNIQSSVALTICASEQDHEQNIVSFIACLCAAMKTWIHI